MSKMTNEQASETIDQAPQFVNRSPQTVPQAVQNDDNKDGSKDQNNTNVIVATQLRKMYRQHAAVHSLDLNVKKGELFGFLGPNGAGKTTTIEMMVGLLKPSEGTVTICGHDMWTSPLQAKQHLAYIPDHPHLYAKLTGWEFLRFIASVFHVDEAAFKQRAAHYLHLFQLTDQANDLIESYSHGMRQKMALCAGLIHRPDVLFLDEPTVGLDPNSARTLKHLLRQLCEAGTTVFMSTHILEIAEHMCDRIGIIMNGELIALGTMSELRQRQGSNSGTEGNVRLEDIFMHLTGGTDEQDLIQVLAEEDYTERDR